MQPIESGISLACPFFNEEAAVPLFFSRVIPVLESIGRPFEIVCVNDGSSDGTLKQLLEAQATDRRIIVVDLSRNFGKEAALTAAIDHARGDAVIPMDADLQDPPELMPLLVKSGNRDMRWCWLSDPAGRTIVS